MMKLSVLGGSSYYTSLLFEALVQHREDIRITELALYGRNESKLADVARFGANMFKKAGIDTAVTFTTDRRRAIEGSQLILCQIRVGGMQARAIDESIPRRYGITGDETVGPGGFSCALRTVPVMADIAAGIRRWAPEALVVDLTNPAGIVVEAILNRENINIIGICDLPLIVLTRVADVLNLDYDGLSGRYFGLNHLGFYSNIYYNGDDITAAVLEHAEQLGLGIDTDLVNSMRLVPVPFLRHFYHHSQVVEEQKQQPVRGQVLYENEQQLSGLFAQAELDDIPQTIRQRNAIWYSHAVVPFMAAYVSGQKRRFIVNIRNRGRIAGLDDNAVVEVSEDIDALKMWRTDVIKMPLYVRGLVQAVKAFESMTVQAIYEGSYDKAVLALMSHPLVGQYDVAKAILDDILRSYPEVDYLK
ncbi:MAG: 6-phospho-beta-glucosidase [Clostridiales bacterium]|nr:6-phospho-beta-glucosidase [Clostridiales bacterium]